MFHPIAESLSDFENLLIRFGESDQKLGGNVIKDLGNLFASFGKSVQKIWEICLPVLENLINLFC